MQELIYKQSALSICKEYCWLDDEDFIEGYNTAIKDISEAIKELPAVEAEPVRRGRWDEIQCFSEHGIEMASYECTSCGNDIERQRGLVPQYCEFCGAKMYQTDSTISKERFAEIGGTENG